jgi:lysyl-tRNA synthetase class 2
MTESQSDQPEQSEPADVASEQDLQMHVAARRDKLRQIQKLGIDPWGSRFDDRQLIGEIRDRISEVQFQQEDGTRIDLPDLECDVDDRVNMRQWRSDQGPGAEVGPTVRAIASYLRDRRRHIPNPEDLSAYRLPVETELH